ncbi:antibiotic biosynthesis monooxygenase [Aeromicrobium marinum DSM 15272]|uniref:Antibiotic biosynthesis monooxygenase n=1 Tax=Aeromicrobium marinum DSM 15272 TaxID=585531 RepID=E2SEX2_9ACTN|nr:antibiotic biosynthesis monooxygenase [Aeromicrobium marinum]EFQ82216.1 antibiotic biosynthesis monooxygenase [Aeromicrobium marinum DSM 15272]
MTGPVTVSITRHVDPGHEDQMLAWLRAGTQLSERFDGFLGSGWVRPAPGSTEWHMLYRFADAASLQAWDSSEQRRWWLESAQGFVEEARHEQRTGIEGWFDEPTSVDVADLRPAPAPPPRWKQMCAIFCVFFPLSIAANATTSTFLDGVPLVLRVLVSVLAMTPIMTYLALPWITRLLAPWLNAPRRT